MTSPSLDDVERVSDEQAEEAKLYYASVLFEPRSFGPLTGKLVLDLLADRARYKGTLSAMSRAPQNNGGEITDAHIGAALEGAIYPPDLAAAGKIVRNRLLDHCGAHIVAANAPPSRTFDAGLRRAAWPKVHGTGRMFDNEKALLVCFAEKPTDDELRAFDDAIKSRSSELTTAPQPLSNGIAEVNNDIQTDS